MLFITSVLGVPLFIFFQFLPFLFATFHYYNQLIIILWFGSMCMHLYISFKTSFHISNHQDTSYILFTIFKVLLVTFLCINYQEWIFASDMKGRFNFHFFPYGNTPYPGIIYGIYSPLPTDLTCYSGQISLFTFV